MATDSSENSQPDDASSTQADASGVVERVERGLLDRRQFLKGVVAGGATVGAAGTGAVVLSEGTTFQPLAALAGGESGSRARTTYYLPAVDSAGRGRIVGVSVAFTETEGLFVNLHGLEVRHDLQVALREATATAREYTEGQHPNGLMVSFAPQDDEFLALRGKSWEAGLTVSLAAVLQGTDIGRETLVTGVVAPDGDLLPVGSIEAKAQAAREIGASTLLVPAGQTRQTRGIAVEGMTSIEAVLDTVLPA